MWQSLGDTGPGSLVASEDAEIDDVHGKPIVSLACFVSDDTQFTATGGSSAPTWVTGAGHGSEGAGAAGSGSAHAHDSTCTSIARTTVPSAYIHRPYHRTFCLHRLHPVCINTAACTVASGLPCDDIFRRPAPTPTPASRHPHSPPPPPHSFPLTPPPPRPCAAFVTFVAVSSNGIVSCWRLLSGGKLDRGSGAAVGPMHLLRLDCDVNTATFHRGSRQLCVLDSTGKNAYLCALTGFVLVLTQTHSSHTLAHTGHTHLSTPVTHTSAHQLHTRTHTRAP